MVQWPDLLCGIGDDGSGLICSVVVVMMVQWPDLFSGSGDGGTVA